MKIIQKLRIWNAHYELMEAEMSYRYKWHYVFAFDIKDSINNAARVRTFENWKAVYMHNAIRDLHNYSPRISERTMRIMESRDPLTAVTSPPKQKGIAAMFADTLNHIDKCEVCQADVTVIRMLSTYWEMEDSRDIYMQRQLISTYIAFIHERIAA